MATPSPVRSTGGTIDGSVLPSPLGTTSSKSLRGLNKPKCIKCGNVARSRCPYQSCKSCCAKAQNPCHIHVLKGSSSLPDKPPSSPLFEQQSADGSHPGNSHRLRQLSNNFSQFSSLQAPFRARKPLTKKDAQVINEWRFIKLKEFKDGKAQAESEAFDRYMQSVSLLEEVFSVLDQPHGNESTDSNDTECSESLISTLSLNLRTDLERSENFRKRIKEIVDQGVRKLGSEPGDGAADEINETEIKRPSKMTKPLQGEKETGLSDLIDKLNKARNEDDLKECRDMASQLFGSGEKDTTTSPEDVSMYSPLKWVSSVSVSQECLCRIDAQFSSLDEIEDL